ncbi:alpha/beta fold hydrolase [Motilibacter peucedani]
MVAANGARFHVAEAGTGPLVLLLHGFPQMWWTWRHVLPALAAAGYRAAAMDLRGYGASDKTPRGYDPATLTADIAGVVRSLGSADAVLVGHGLGGMLAWTTAVAHPKVVRRLAAIAAPHPLRMRSAVAGDLRQLRRSRHVLGFQAPMLPERRLTESDGAYVEQLLRAWAAPGWPSAEEAAVYRQAVQVAGVAHCSLEYSRWAVRSMVRPDGARYARGMREPVRVPVLHLHGAADGAVLPRSAAGSDRFVEAPYRWHLVAGVGHFPQEERPEELVRLLLGWLDDPEPDR